MLVDTHCHLNIMVKKQFDIPLTIDMISPAQKIADQAAAQGVTTIINVGTSLIESKNSVLLAQNISSVYATVGIHPNDCTVSWKKELNELEQLLKKKEKNKIVGVGECGIDRHYPEYDLQRQYDAFKAQIELALEYNVGLVVHSRDAYDETLRVLEEYVRHEPRAVMHCFSYDKNFASQVIEWKFKLGIGGALTYPKNNELREVAKSVELSDIVLETDAPFLPVQAMRGQQNSPAHIKTIAEYLAELRSQDLQTVASATTHAAQTLFGLTI